MATFSRISIEAFKKLTNSTFLDVVKSPKTGKLFLSNQDGSKYNVHQEIDLDKNVEILVITEDDTESYCLVNKNVSSVLKTF